MDKLGAMRTFVEIVERGSLTAAGEALSRSLPTMVRTLAQLEKELGVVLLRRTTRRMSLTEEGRVYLERCRRILADVAEAEALVRPGEGTPRGRLRVTAPVSFGQMHLTQAVAAFVAQHEGVEVELLLLDRVVGLVEEGLDVALRIGALEDSALVATKLGEMRRVICASPSRLESDGEPGHPRELAKRPCVGFSGLFHVGMGYTEMGANWPYRDHGADRQVRVRGRFGVNQAASAIEACAAGLGFGAFLAYQVAPAIREGRLVVVLEEFEPPPLPVSLVYADARLMSPRLRAFIDAMKTQLSDRDWRVGARS